MVLKSIFEKKNYEKLLAMIPRLYYQGTPLENGIT